MHLHLLGPGWCSHTQHGPQLALNNTLDVNNVKMVQQRFIQNVTRLMKELDYFLNEVRRRRRRRGEKAARDRTADKAVQSVGVLETRARARWRLRRPRLVRCSGRIDGGVRARQHVQAAQLPARMQCHHPLAHFAYATSPLVARFSLDGPPTRFLGGHEGVQARAHAHTHADTNTRVKKLRDMVLLGFNETALVLLLLNTSQLEYRLRNMFTLLLKQKRVSWDKYKTEASERMDELCTARACARTGVCLDPRAARAETFLPSCASRRSWHAWAPSRLLLGDQGADARRAQRAAAKLVQGDCRADPGPRLCRRHRCGPQDCAAHSGTRGSARVPPGARPAPCGPGPPDAPGHAH